MDEKDALDYLGKQIDSKRRNDEDKYIGKFLIVAFLIMTIVGGYMMPDRTEDILSIFLITFGSLGMGYIFGFERGKKVER